MLKWFSIPGIMTEVKRIRWPQPKEMVKDSLTVVTFTVAFGLYFVLCEYGVAAFLKLLGIGA